MKEYVDDGYSGARLDRPALEELRRDVKTPLFDGGDAQAWPLELVFMPRSYQKSSIGDRVSLHLTDIDTSADVGSAIIEDRFDIK